jgi:HEAT repeat protein
VIGRIRSGGSLPYADLQALAAPSDTTVRAVMGLWPAIGVERRREVLAALQDLSEDDAALDFDRIYLSALRDPDAATRILAIRGLWEYEREELAALLIELLRSDLEPTVRREAAAALGRFVVSMEFGMLSEEESERLTDALRDAVEEIDESEELRATALESVGASSEEWVTDLIADQYELGSPRMRLAAVRAMGRNGADEWLAVLFQTFEDDDEEIRAAAAMSSGQLLLERAVEPLSRLLLDDEEEVRLAAIGALGEIASAEAEEVLSSVLRSNDPRMVTAARQALAEARMNALDPNLFEASKDAAGDGARSEHGDEE